MRIGVRLRKFSSIKEYSVIVGDAQIIDVDYEKKVDEMLAKKIDALSTTKIKDEYQELDTVAWTQANINMPKPRLNSFGTN